MARRLPAEQLRAKERMAGWVTYHCAEHGFLVAGPADMVVLCGVSERGRKCGRKAVRMRDGEPLTRQEVYRLNRHKKALQNAGS